VAQTLTRYPVSMQSPPRWYKPLCVILLSWNLLGCMAYLNDVTLKPEDVAKMPADMQAMYAARPMWAVAAFATAVWGGALGSLLLLLRKRAALPLLVASVVSLVFQNFGLFVLAGAGRTNPAAYIVQGLVFAIAVGLVVLARRATARGWLGAAA
jgi:hypothetical protein